MAEGEEEREEREGDGDRVLAQLFSIILVIENIQSITARQLELIPK